MFKHRNEVSNLISIGILYYVCTCDLFIVFQLDEFEKLDYTSQLTDLKNQVQLKEQQLGKTFFQLERFDEEKKC